MESAKPNLEAVLLRLETILQRLNADEIACISSPEILNETLDEAISQSLKEFPEVAEVSSAFSDRVDYGSGERWRFVGVICSSLVHLREEIHGRDLSLSHQRIVKKSVMWVVLLGIVPNLIKGIKVQVKDAPGLLVSTEDVSDLQKYRRLCAIVKLLVQCLESPDMRCIVLQYLGCLLVALCQLGYAPLKKPSQSQTQDDISLGDFEKLLKDQMYYKSVLCKLLKDVFPPIVIQELMIIQGGQKEKTQPLWLIKTCTQLLTHLLLQPGGVSAVIRSTLESSVDTGADWKTVTILTKIITSPKNHYENICQQLSELVTSSNVSKACISVSMACINELLVKDPSTTNNVIIDKLLEPLTRLSSEKIDSCSTSDDIIVQEEEFTVCFECLHQYFNVKCSSSSSSCLPSYLLYPVSHILFNLYAQIRGNISHVTSLVADLLYLLNECQSETLGRIIRTVVFKEPSDNILVPSNVLFVLGSNGGVKAIKPKIIERGIEYSAVEEAGDVLMHLLDKKDSDGSLSNKLFIILLKTIADFGIDPKNLDSCSNLLGTVEDLISELVTRSERHGGAVRLLAALADKTQVQNHLSKNPDCIVGFLEILLQRQIDSVSNFKDTDFSDNQDIFCLTLMILEVVVSGNRHKINWDSFQTLVPLLERLKKIAVNSELRDLSSSIYNTLATRGILKSKPESSVNEQIREDDSIKSDESECELAFNDACDPLLPVRGHAILKLTELITKGDRKAVAKKDAILCLFQENLKNVDSYIYLAAINGMASLTNYFPDTVLETLTEEFVSAVSAANSDAQGDNLTRMKIGEVLVKVTKLLGEMVSKYKNQLLNTFLVGIKDSDPLVRASSLSNLGEVCRVLGFRIGPVLQEILLSTKNVISSEKSAEPRRAAVMVLTMLLQGLDKDALEVLADDVLLVYRALKNLYLRETDSTVRLHAQLALEEVDNIARTLFFPQSALEKKMVV